MAHDEHAAEDHGHGDDAHVHGHEHAYAHGPGHKHEHEHAHTAESNSGALPDLAKVAILINNWIDHNEGHRRTYLEWRDKLLDAGVPDTVAALSHVADLTDQATVELRAAAAELQRTRPPQS